MKPTFTITKKSNIGRARLGVLRTPHGVIHTPAYVIVATHGTVRTLTPRDLKKTKTQVVIANTYHLWNKKNVHAMLGTRLPMMTDSGGFQVFSLGAAKEQGVGKVLKQPHTRSDIVSKVRISDRGVYFVVDGKKRFLSPESSIQIQERLGADIIFAFDECTSPLHPAAYTRVSMERTHRWAKRCIKEMTRFRKASARQRQMLFGIVQGGRFKSLRTASAKALAAMPFDGYGIGGSFGKDEMAKTLAWVIPQLPHNKPRHLLGIGTVADVFTAVEAGVDTFDCVIPTREGRHGRIYTDGGPKNIKIKSHAEGRLATIKNVTWFNNLLKNIRTALNDGSYPQFKRRFFKRYASAHP